jgi:ABC-type Fe3+-hydroxamate transport system substrate-binding protein
MSMPSSGNGHKRSITFDHPPQRVVSLVPSLTESMFELGLGSALVGITDYCIYPAEAVSRLPRIGGTKNPRVTEIVALKPELVLANQEENTRQTVEAIEAQGVFVWVTFPKTVREALDVLWTLTGVFFNRTAAIRLETLELTLDWAISSSLDVTPRRYFCPIWEEDESDGNRWWMTFNRYTYCHDVLRIAGGENVFADRERRYPLAADLGNAASEEAGDRDTRYPRVTLDEICSLQPEMILLPSEPFSFNEGHVDVFKEIFAGTPAAQQDRIILVDGSLITWHGTRLARALQELPALFSKKDF